jgi:osmotically inducible protein OsmC
MTMAAVRHAEVAWDGDLVSGSGMIRYVSSGVISRLPVTWGSRTEAHDGRTSPEELLAAAHASCYSMSLSGGLARNGTPATHLEVRADVTFARTDAGWRVVSSALTVQGTVPGIDETKFVELATAAKDGCPISQALKGNVELSVVPTLVF